MKRLNVILGKKQLVIASLAVLLGAAAAANFLYAGKNDGLTKPAEQVSANYGEAEYVSNTADSDAYFAQARLDKQASRDEAAEVLAGMYQGGDLTVDELDLVKDDALQLSKLIDSENRIETLLKAQGFDDALCYLSENSANIIVKTDGLDAQQAAVIKSTLLSEYEVSGDCITIVEVT